MIKNYILTISALFVFCSGGSALQAGVIRGSIPVSISENGNATNTVATRTFTIVQKGDSVSRLVIQSTDTHANGETETQTETYGLSRTSYGGTVSYSDTYPGGSADSGSYPDGGPASVRLKKKKQRGRVRGGTVSITLMANGGSMYTGGSPSSYSSTRRIIASVGKKSGLSYLRSDSDTYGSPAMTVTETESGKGKAKGKIK